MKTFPVARAGAAFKATDASGEFQGIILEYQVSVAKRSVIGEYKASREAHS